MKKNYAAGIITLKINGFIRQHVDTWLQVEEWAV